MPKTDKDGLLNQIKMIHNKVERLRAVQDSGESLTEISLLFAALIDDLSPARVQFQWESAAEREAGVKSTREGIAAFCAENPSMVD